MKILLVTNDFPPRVGGIQSYLWNIYRRLAENGHTVRVLAPADPGAAAHDETAGMEVVRWDGPIQWPTRALERRIRDLSRDMDAVAFGAVLPMNLIAPRLTTPTVIHTHGFEVAWARTPGLRAQLKRIGCAAAVVTVIGDYTHALIRRALGESARIEMLRTGVDLERFHPTVDASQIRARHSLGNRPVVSCVSRLVARKGQDQIIRALPEVRSAVPDAAVLFAGKGPARARLEKLVQATGVAHAVTFAGEVPEEELAAYYAAGDVFAMPCRSRLGGLDVEGLGLVYVEAQACARPAITGDSGGAPEAVIDAETGFVVPGRDTRALAGALIDLLANPDRARAFGAAGRTFVERTFRWEHTVERYTAMLHSI